MITHQDMVDLYGPDNVVTLAHQEVDRLGVAPQDAEVLANVGLPCISAPFFTTRIHGGPEFLRVIDVTTRDATKHREVIVGGPPGDSGMRFSLSAYERFVTLMDLGGTKPRGEVVNNNLVEFVEFLYRIEMFTQGVAADPAVKEARFDDLQRALTGIDPFSFELPENWWAMALRQLGGDDPVI
ncbi:SUKH-4 family immunity protein [Amycolatopsis thermalba]|uniref:SUKH-4 family immunity protein n=1 Tax=Amycolatopsis thermalba TaxID=944492 RepID=A0ABY4NW47_9PSEU|nr:MULTISPECIES: SUKH-4 family immunity protein [Amycolatopsis]UQS24270.1 SUKH-4 family immunity protein [Amycolatopsis thermalba]